MSSYIGSVLIGSEQYPIGSTIYAICRSAANAAEKTTTRVGDNQLYTAFDTIANGVTIPICFLNGNTVTSGVKLSVGTSSLINVEGNCVCGEGDVISFTLEDNNGTQVWRAHHILANVSEDLNSGLITIDGQQVGSGLAQKISDLNTTVSNINNSLGGLSGAMHFKGSVAVDPTKQSLPNIETYAEGDVVLGPNNKEYVYTGTTWLELGDEGSYVLKSSQSTTNINNVTGLTSGTLPTLTPASTTASLVTVVPGTAPSLSTDKVDIPVVTQAGTATIASVTGGVLTITLGSNTELSQTDASVISTVSFQAGTTPSTVTSTDVTFGAVDNNSFNGGAFPTVVSSPVTVVVPVTTPQG